MNYCPACGTQAQDGARFCANCGGHLEADTTGPVVATRQEPAASTAIIPPAAPAADSIAHDGPDPRAVLMRLLTGNWVGAAIIAFVTMLSAYLLSLIYVGIELGDWSLGGMIKNAANLTFSAFGVPLNLSANGEHASVFSAPLLITLVSSAVGVFTFRRVVHRYPSTLDAVWDGLRTGVVFGVFFTAAAVVVHIVKPWVAEMPNGDGPGMGAPLNGWSSVQAVPSMAGAIFIPALASAIVLAVAALRSPLAMTQRFVAVAASISRPAFKGLQFLIWSTLPAGLVQMISQLTVPDASHSFETITRQIFTLPNYGVATLGIGVGAPFGNRGTGFKDEVDRVGGLADQANWVVWLSIPVALAVLVISAYLVARSSATLFALWSTAAYLVGLLVVLPLLGILANASLRATIDDDVTKWRIGIDITEMTFISWAGSILACLAALLLVGKLRVAHLQARPGA